MNNFKKLKILDQSGKYDICGWSSRTKKYSRNNIVVNDLSGIYNATLPDGRRCALLKTLMTNRCENDCLYCVNRAGRKVKKENFNPEELSKLFLDLYSNNQVQGLFLSSGVYPNPDCAMEQILDSARILREKHAYNGYIHLKIMPGSSYEFVKQAVELANRVSINLELPSKDWCSQLAPQKDYYIDLMRRMGWIKGLIARSGRRVTQTTQFIVGACEERDVDILKMVDRLHKEFETKRCLFSAFSPIKQTPLENRTQTPLLREHRLYQAEYLLRLYRVKFHELVFAETGNLRTDIDPKLAIALENREIFPVDINQASYEELIRVPGIGPKSAVRILELRAKKIESYTELQGIGVVVGRAKPFLKIDNRLQTSIEDYISANNPLYFQSYA